MKARFAQIASTLPPDIKADVLNDQSLFIEAAVRSLEEHLVAGSFLAALVIFFFLANVRTTIIAAIAIPTSIIATFALMRVMGYTLNQITMLALTLMVGVVIDDAIIVLENIYRFIEEKGMPPFEAAIEGTQGDRPCRHGDDAVAHGGVRAGWIHGRDRRPVHVVVRPDRGVRRRHFVDHLVHVDADAQFPVDQGSACQERRALELQGIGVVPSNRSHVHGHAALVDGSSRRHRRR